MSERPFFAPWDGSGLYQAPLLSLRSLDSAFSILPFAFPVHGEARRSAWKLRDAGQTIPWNDVVVATLALGRKWRVYARDHHFDLMRDVLGLRLYEPDYGGKFRPE